MSTRDDLARTRLYDEIADALGAMPEAYNVRDITDEETTMLSSLPVEMIAAHLASVVSRRDADLRTAARHVVKSFREVEHNRQLYDVATHRCVDELARALDAGVAP